MFGSHIKVVGTAPEIILRDGERLRKAIAQLTEKSALESAGPPQIYDLFLAGKGGIVGAQLSAHGHIVVHAWPERSLFMVDVFSSETIRGAAVMDHFVSHFAATQLMLRDLSAALLPN